jgi:hypothetical protein
MKNTSHSQTLSKRHQTEARTRHNGPRFPEISASYQASNLSGSCGKPAKFAEPSFNDISKDYFAAEEPRGFAVDAALFATLIALAVLPIVNTVQAVAPFVRQLGLL